MVKIQTFILLLGLSLGVSAKNSGVTARCRQIKGDNYGKCCSLVDATDCQWCSAAGKLPGGGGARSCHKSGNPCRKDAWFTDYRDGTPPIYWSDCNLD
ncbi:hypothetical protein TUN199_02158 [Pyrenophora tritici-repentis]|uniref:Uncharacterized protein n=1 Tax=Pyrenophora tritici-repentis TaxID=45151 RepID=A0A5M9L9D8_9PLEO|nr:hypothetical protein PtrV1_08296 [Pyrenophora tritici-repentis]KAF7449333.1 hypothetical protein A1F99_063820 [Pyrenophora tritici-repentis]KAF7570651.1 hypothetical protein PtrM4_106530 [Pyrenophora tritici-repentis]KAI0585258.1 hypothetical protein Alg215_02649 [Pyrenophora tritici-repentis]KAI0590848.1 hypothetical protein Alg130_01880 [Pyrenophora tritici-repentis]